MKQPITQVVCDVCHQPTAGKTIGLTLGTAKFEDVCEVCAEKINNKIDLIGNPKPRQPRKPRDPNAVPKAEVRPKVNI